MLVRPSTTVAAATGPELSPIAFAALHAWKTQGMHTVSVGFARASDLDEVVDAARMFSDMTGKTNDLLKAAESKLEEIAAEKLGKDWYEKGLLNVPSFFTKSSDGMAIGHMLWLHNCLTAYGLYEFAKDRYGMLEAPSAKWKKSRTFEENKKKCL
jgi:predicted aldo/keto reductase-like oxidoreductase